MVLLKEKSSKILWNSSAPVIFLIVGDTCTEISFMALLVQHRSIDIFSHPMKKKSVLILSHTRATLQITGAHVSTGTYSSRCFSTRNIHRPQLCHGARMKRAKSLFIKLDLLKSYVYIIRFDQLKKDVNLIQLIRSLSSLCQLLIRKR